MDRIEREKEIARKMIYMYGPPGSGKTSLGRALAENLALPFSDLDQLIQARTGMSIPAIFAAAGEAGFREHESLALESLLAGPAGVAALGGGALLDPRNRALAESTGCVLCLNAPLETLQARLRADSTLRPLLVNHPPTDAHNPQSPITDHESPITNHPSPITHEKLASLLAARSAHYASFPLQLDTSIFSVEESAWQAQVRLGMFRVAGMGPAYDVRVAAGGLDDLGELIQERNLGGPLALVSDTNVARIYAEGVLESLRRAGYAAELLAIPAGEEFKTLIQVQELWSGFLAAGLERASTVVALGGGVVGDLAGFAAATYLRGVRWVVVPTSLLAMIDASLGGKTGADLPQGKNLVGAFHPPALVLADPAVLRSLPEAELRSGLAEVVKHGVIGDTHLFELCAQGWDGVMENLEEIVRRAMAVKIQVIQADPYEQGWRAVLNLGHTLGHALELASGYQIRHGEGVAIGMLAAARLSERLGLAETGLAERIRAVLSGLGLPAAIPLDLDREQILTIMSLDKKRRAGKVRLALPTRIGEVRFGIVIDDLRELLNV